VTLNAGEYLEIEWQGGLQVRGTGPLTVGQFMVGEDFGGHAPLPPDIGDPSFALVSPVQQWRTSYDFLAPDTYTANFVYVVRRAGDVVVLDSDVLPAGDPIEGTDYVTSRTLIEPGAHHIEGVVPADSSEAPPTFGIMVSGIAPYTSYLYAGGLDLTPIF
jgi:hypothetical protein